MNEFEIIAESRARRQRITRLEIIGWVVCVGALSFIYTSEVLKWISHT